MKGTQETSGLSIIEEGLDDLEFDVEDVVFERIFDVKSFIRRHVPVEFAFLVAPNNLHELSLSLRSEELFQYTLFNILKKPFRMSEDVQHRVERSSQFIFLKKFMVFCYLLNELINKIANNAEMSGNFQQSLQNLLEIVLHERFEYFLRQPPFESEEKSVDWVDWLCSQFDTLIKTIDNFDYVDPEEIESSLVSKDDFIDRINKDLVNISIGIYNSISIKTNLNDLSGRPSIKSYLKKLYTMITGQAPMEEAAQPGVLSEAWFRRRYPEFDVRFVPDIALVPELPPLILPKSDSFWDEYKIPIILGAVFAVGSALLAIALSGGLATIPLAVIAGLGITSNMLMSVVGAVMLAAPVCYGIAAISDSCDEDYALTSQHYSLTYRFA